MSEAQAIGPSAEPVDVIVGQSTLQQVVLVEVFVTQGLPGAPGDDAAPSTPAEVIGALGYTPADIAGDTFTGIVKGSTFVSEGNLGGFQFGPRDGLGGKAWVLYTQSGPALAFYSETHGNVAELADTGTLTLKGAGQMVVGGDRVTVKGGSATLFTDGATYAQLAMGPNTSLIQFSWGSNMWLFYANGVAVMSIDAAGNMKVKGSVTPNVTPAEFEAALAMPPMDAEPPI